MKKVMRNIFLKLIFNTQEKYVNFIVTYHFYPKKRNLEKLKSVLQIYVIKTEYVVHMNYLKQA